MDFMLQFPGMSSSFCCMTRIFPFSVVECCIFWYSYKYFWALFWETVIWKPFDLFEISFWTLLSRTPIVLTWRWLFSSTLEYPCALGTFLLWRKRTQTWDFPLSFFWFLFPYFLVISLHGSCHQHSAEGLKWTVSSVFSFRRPFPP